MDQSSPARDRICNAMLDLMETRPFEEVSITELCKRAGVSRTSFYRFFDSVYDVLQAIEDAYSHEIPGERAATSSLSEHLRPADARDYSETEFAEVIAQNFRVYRLITGANGDPSFKARMRNRVTRTMQQALEPALGTGPRAQAAATMLAGTRMYAMDWWAAHATEVDAAAYSRYVSELTVAAMNAMVDAARTSSQDLRAK